MSATVTIAMPVRNEEERLAATLRSVAAQTYPHVVEVLVADGRSTDRTREIATGFPDVRVLDNPGIRQAAGLNLILEEAKGDVIVRVDGHCLLEPDYVERCVAALHATGAAMVGGAMDPVADRAAGTAIAVAMTSRIGAGPARFHVGGHAGWVDTVYLGAYRAETVRAAGGYADDVGVNEDAELAFRLAQQGGVWFDPAISSTYTPRSSLAAVARQFYAYGRSRSATVRRHPRSLSARQLAAPALLVALATPARRRVIVVYGLVLAAGAFGARGKGIGVAARVPAVMAAMHLAWGTGFLAGLTVAPPRRAQ
jgi:glycosyltransferase involved in cell wall biosynthesis